MRLKRSIVKLIIALKRSHLDGVVELGIGYGILGKDTVGFDMRKAGNFVGSVRQKIGPTIPPVRTAIPIYAVSK
jgi:hypothetical protein